MAPSQARTGLAILTATLAIAIGASDADAKPKPANKPSTRRHGPTAPSPTTAPKPTPRPKPVAKPKPEPTPNPSGVAKPMRKGKRKAKPKGHRADHPRRPAAPPIRPDVDNCTDEAREDERTLILEEASDGRYHVNVTCSHVFGPDDVITKRLFYTGSAGSNIFLDCRGAVIDGTDTVNEGRDMIEIRSSCTREDGECVSWTPVEHVAIHRCTIHGGIRIHGMGKNGEGEHVRESSRRTGHVARVQANAPRDILLDELAIIGTGRTPLYVSPGVHRVTLQHSDIGGHATSVGVYLDTESSHNVLRHNHFHTVNRRSALGIVKQRREEIAVDNSNHNLIYGNRFTALFGGGIFLYRNCGEGGTVRHGTPSHNAIINNVFDFGGRNPRGAAIHVGSRSNTATEGRLYCGDDAGFPWGSSVDDHSFARHNVVTENRLIRRSVAHLVIEGDRTNHPNLFENNTTVASAEDRPSGCMAWEGHKRYLTHGESIDVVREGPAAVCSSERLTCNDGEIERSPAGACHVQRRDFDCRVTGDNAGCQETIECPAGTQVVGITAACNLEHGTVSDVQLESVDLGNLRVFRPSGGLAGSCGIDGITTKRVPEDLEPLVGGSGITVRCQEHDKNGGDCQIRGRLYCG